MKAGEYVFCYCLTNFSTSQELQLQALKKNKEIKLVLFIILVVNNLISSMVKKEEKNKT